MARKLFVFDLHGTLYTDDYKILSSTKKALMSLYNQGHIVAISSGHHYSKVASLNKELGIKIIAISNTGALIKNFENNEIHQYGFIQDKLVYDVINIFQKYPSVLYIHNKKEHKVVINNLSKNEIDKLPVPIKENDYCSLEYAKNMIKDKISQISIKTKEEYIQKIYDEISILNNYTPPHRLDNVMNIFVDCGPQNTNKWTGVLNIAKDFNINKKDIYCFGDNQNDYIMLRHCHNSIAMGNALIKIKSISKYITTSNNNDGIANFLNDNILHENKLPKGLYAITSNDFPKYNTNIKSAQVIIDAGIKILQYREKNANYQIRLKEAKIIKDMCFKNGVIFIINDDLKLAKEVNADGIHIGIEDINKNGGYKNIRFTLGENKIIGLSVYDEKEYDFAKKTDCNYLGVGAIYKTNTKLDARVIDKELLKEIIKESNKDIVAIGGININNIDNISHLGIKHYAIISELFLSNDINKLINDYKIKMANLV